ncbi:unnamed protein product, partial [Iphiclides podalirius]
MIGVQSMVKHQAEPSLGRNVRRNGRGVRAFAVSCCGVGREKLDARIRGSELDTRQDGDHKGTTPKFDGSFDRAPRKAIVLKRSALARRSVASPQPHQSAAAAFLPPDQSPVKLHRVAFTASHF